MIPLDEDMEVIPLHTPRTLNWKRVAKRVVQKAWENLQNLKNKSELRIQCDVDAFLTICKDPYYATLSRWDVNGTRPRKHVLESDEIVCDANLVVHQREYVSWWTHNLKRKSYTVLHCKVDEEGNLVEYEGYWFMVLDSGTIFVQSNQNVARLHYLETMARNDRTLEVFKSWTCKYCNILTVASRLDCAKCRRGRYWNCPNAQCEGPQAQGDEICRKCGVVKK